MSYFIKALNFTILQNKLYRHFFGRTFYIIFEIDLGTQIWLIFLVFVYARAKITRKIIVFLFFSGMDQLEARKAKQKHKQNKNKFSDLGRNLSILTECKVLRMKKQ